MLIDQFTTYPRRRVYKGSVLDMKKGYCEMHQRKVCFLIHVYESGKHCIIPVGPRPGLQAMKGSRMYRLHKGMHASERTDTGV